MVINDINVLGYDSCENLIYVHIFDLTGSFSIFIFKEVKMFASKWYHLAPWILASHPVYPNMSVLSAFWQLKSKARDLRDFRYRL